MKMISKLTVMAAVIIVASMTSCGKDGGSPGGGDAYIPDIGQQWQRLNTPAETYYFNYLGSSTAATGSFSKGFKTVSGVDQGAIAGSFNHSQINFTVTLNGASTAYNGTISGTPTKTMVLNGLTLTKQ